MVLKASFLGNSVLGSCSFLSLTSRMPFKAVLVADPAQLKPEGAIRLLCLSDTHGQHSKIPSEQLYPADILIFAGDFSLFGNPVNVESFKSWLHSFQIAAVAIPGNCDLTSDPARLESYRKRIETFCHRTVALNTINTIF
jgi:hypothetical protein